MTMWLVGMMGSGKSSAGRLAAARLRVGFADSDEAAEGAAGRPIVDIWKTLGEEGFRHLESAAIARLINFPGIVATGGGAVLDQGNRRVMTSGTVTWLRADPEVLATRVAQLGRPLLGEGEPEEILADLLQERERLYREVSDHVIDTGEVSVEEVSSRIEELWKG